MTALRVWAPDARQVSLVRSDRHAPMAPEDGGWWFIEDANLVPGARYAFSLDDGPPRPDPRSMDQPLGVHGPSAIVDHATFDWRHDDFRAPPLAQAIFYELHIGTFTPEGDFAAAARRLNHLRDLGVTHVEVMPIAAFDGERGWGYDGVNWFAPHRAYTGDVGPDAVKRFVDACHATGLAVILDVVYNHLGPSGNYLAEFGPYFTDRYTTPWGAAINLDGPDCDEVRRLICDNALMWLRDYHFDGLRLDAVHALCDRSATHILEQLAADVRALEREVHRPLIIIAESDANDPRIVTPIERGGYGVDAQWSDDYHHALHTLITGERGGYYADFGAVAQLAKALANAYVYDGEYSSHRRRRHGRPPHGLRARRFLAYAQNHDQIGNRAQGDRLSMLAPIEACKAAAALTLLSPFPPMLFQGEEWGSRRPFQYFADHQDGALAESIRSGRRNEFAAFGWRPEDIPDPQSIRTFTNSKLDWTELERPEHRSMLQWHRDLIRLRRERPDLHDDRLEQVTVHYNEAQRWIAMRRGAVLVMCNFSEQRRHILWSSVRIAHHKPQTLLQSGECELDSAGATLSPWCAVVLDARA